MTAGLCRAGARIASLPSLTLDEASWRTWRLLLSGAFAPLTGFLGAADIAAVSERATLADGTPVAGPGDAGRARGRGPAGRAARLALNDPEGTPLAILDITERSRP